MVLCYKVFYCLSWVVNRQSVVNSGVVFIRVNSLTFLREYVQQDHTTDETDQYSRQKNSSDRERRTTFDQRPSPTPIFIVNEKFVVQAISHFIRIGRGHPIRSGSRRCQRLPWTLRGLSLLYSF